MMIYDDIFHWPGWGGTLKLASGSCRLRIFDLTRSEESLLIHLKPIIVIVSDLAHEQINDMSIRSCSGHIATLVTKKFNINPERMHWIEYYPDGNGRDAGIEAFISVTFDWHDGKALNPAWKELPPVFVKTLKKLVT